MSSNLYFSVPIPSGGQRQSVRASLHQSKKRKRSHTVSPESTDGEDREDARQRQQSQARLLVPAPATQQDLPSLTVLSPEDAEQYRVAGCLPDQPLPLHFPHRGDPHRSSHQRTGTRFQAEVQRGLSELSPPLFVAATITPAATGGPSRATSQLPKSLRRHHLSVLNTIMHRCLLEGDYARAGRAWGMILRTNIGGKAPDLRVEDRWGIGAEVLLRRKTRLVRRDVDADDGDDDNDDSSDPSTHKDDDDDEDAENHKASSAPQRPPPPADPTTTKWFTDEGFAQAKEYYERLILHYPPHKRWPDKVNALHFYLAMFGLWIYVSQQERRRHQQQQHLFSSSSSRLLRRIELPHAQSIATRLDELLLSPPFSDNPHLWHLRAMIAHWLVDLYLPPDDDDDEEDEEDEEVEHAYLLPIRDVWSNPRSDELDRAAYAWSQVRALMRRAAVAGGAGDEDGEENEEEGEGGL